MKTNTTLKTNSLNNARSFKEAAKVGPKDKSPAIAGLFLFGVLSVGAQTVFQIQVGEA